MHVKEGWWQFYGYSLLFFQFVSLSVCAVCVSLSFHRFLWWWLDSCHFNGLWSRIRLRLDSWDVNNSWESEQQQQQMREKKLLRAQYYIAQCTYIFSPHTYFIHQPVSLHLCSARFGSSWLVISTRSLALCLKFFKYLYRHFSLCLAPLFSALFLSFNINCNIYTLKRNWLLLHTTWLAFFWFHHRHQYQQERGREGEMEIQETNCKYFMKLKWNFDLFLFFHKRTHARWAEMWLLKFHSQSMRCIQTFGNNTFGCRYFYFCFRVL